MSRPDRSGPVRALIYFSGDAMKRMIPMGAALLLVALLLLRPQTAAAAAAEGLRLCARTVVPALFPMLVAVGLLTRLGAAELLQGLFAPLMGPLFHLRGACALPLLAGLLGGYPTGAGAAAALYREGTLHREEAERLLGFCNCCGPSFLLGYVGALLGSSALGGRLLLVHVASALLTGALMCRIWPVRLVPALPSRLPAAPRSLARSFTDAVSAALSATLSICAYVVSFRTAAALLPLPPLCLGAVELIGGLAALPEGRAGFVLAAAESAWGGVSVHCQTAAVAEGLSMRWYWRGKLLQTAIAAALATLVCPL